MTDSQRMHRPVTILAALLFGGCLGSPDNLRSCGECDAGEACGQDGRCQKICVDDEDCESCRCNEGLCAGTSHCDDDDGDQDTGGDADAGGDTDAGGDPAGGDDTGAGGDDD